MNIYVERYLTGCVSFVPTHLVALNYHINNHGSTLMTQSEFDRLLAVLSKAKG